MQISELFEMPYLHPGQMPKPASFTQSYSHKTLSREFVLIGQVFSLMIMFSESMGVLIGVEKNTAQSRVEPQFKVTFKENPVILQGVNKPLQIDQIYLSKSLRNQSIAAYCYTLIVDQGFSIVSDVTHFDPAKWLWKKLAKELRDYTITVWDIDHGPFKDENGQVIRYDGSNIPDHEIWTQGSDFNGSYRVLVMSK